MYMIMYLLNVMGCFELVGSGLLLSVVQVCVYVQLSFFFSSLLICCGLVLFLVVFIVWLISVLNVFFLFVWNFLIDFVFVVSILLMIVFSVLVLEICFRFFVLMMWLVVFLLVVFLFQIVVKIFFVILFEIVLLVMCCSSSVSCVVEMGIVLILMLLWFSCDDMLFISQFVVIFVFVVLVFVIIVLKYVVIVLFDVSMFVLYVDMLYLLMKCCCIVVGSFGMLDCMCLIQFWLIMSGIRLGLGKQW